MTHRRLGNSQTLRNTGHKTHSGKFARADTKAAYGQGNFNQHHSAFAEGGSLVGVWVGHSNTEI